LRVRIRRSSGVALARVPVEQVLITSTAGGVMGITSVDGAPVGDGTIGPVTRALRDGYWGLHDDPRREAMGPNL
jgi:branched-subunit amino acid aminotransferase/4-amino-4-deoxychorismate lyase